MRIDSFDDSQQRDPGVRRELDAAQLGRAIRARKAWIIVPVALCFLGSTAAVNIIKPRYTAEAKILIENQENYFTRPTSTDRDAPPLPDDEAIQSQVQLVTSRDIARETIKTLDLQGDPEFDPMAGGLAPINRLLVLVGLQPDPLRATAEDRMLSAYYERLNVYPVVKSRVLSVQFTSVDADLAAKAANTVAERYIALQSDAKRDAARSAARSLATLIADLRVRVAEAETKAQEYRAQNGLLVGTNNTPLASQQLADLATQLAQAHTAQADAQAKAKVLREMIKANRIGDVPDVANSDLTRRIADQRVLIKAQIAQQSMTLLPGHPKMRELNAQLADLDVQLRAAGEKTARQLENDAHIAAGRVENLQAALDTSKKNASSAGNDEVALRSLEQQASLLKDQLALNTQKYQEAVARENAVSTPADARIISRAVAPELPSFPKKLPTIAIFTFAGLIFAIGVLIARELLSGRAFTAEREAPSQVSDSRELVLRPAPTPRPTLAEIEAAAESEADASWPVAEDDADLAAVVAAVKGTERTSGAVRVMMTGADDAVPVTPAALRLARALARDARVILVDFGTRPDLLSGLIGAVPGEAPPPGLSDLAAGRTTFSEVIHRDPLSRAHLVPAGALPDSGEVGDFRLLVDALGETYDRVVIAAPVPAQGDTLRGMAGADLAVLLLAARHAEGEEAACRAALLAAGAPTVMTMAAEDRALDATRAAA